MRKVYVLQIGSYIASTDRYEFYDVEVFSSRKKMEASVDNRMIDCNKGYDILKENFDYSSENNKYSMVTYKCLSTDNKEMKIRYLLKCKTLQ